MGEVKTDRLCPIGIILLAAGASRRFGSDKLREKLGNRMLIEWSIEAAKASGLGPLVVVVRRDQSVPSTKVIAVVNFHPEEGLSSSVRCGLAAAQGEGWAAAIFAPADQPRLSPEVFLRLAGAYRQGAEVAVASYQGQPRNPVLLASSRWDEAMRLTGDIGLAAMARLGGKAGEVRVECGDIASVEDVDTLADLERLAYDWPHRKND